MPDAPHIRFSAVIPAYQAEATIVAAVRSCLEQTYAPHEVIVVDDAGTDGTEAALRLHFGEAVRYLRLTVNGGPSAARNAGLDLASGDFIALLDADDEWHPRKLELVAQLLAVHPDAGFVAHPFTTGAFPEPLPPAASFARSWNSLLWRNPVGTPCAVFRPVPGLRFCASMRYMEDYDFFLRLYARFGLRWLDVPLTRIGRPVLSEGGLSASRWRMRKGEWKAYFRLAARRPEFALLLPALLGFSAAKHLVKSLAGLLRKKARPGERA